VNPEAYETYLKGRYFWNKRTADGLKKATYYFNRAIEGDPNYSLPYIASRNRYIGWSLAPAKSVSQLRPH
jgi:hypothetical protein